MTKKTTKKEKSREEILEEIKALAKKGDESSGQQMNLFALSKMGDEDIDIGFDSVKLKDIANPDKSFKLYYGIQRLLREYLPKGKENKKLRQYVYDEKNLFLNRGIEKNAAGLRGSDGRMVFISNFLEVAFDLVVKWIAAGANSYDVYQEFWNLNEERGYHDQQKNTSTFDALLKGVLSVPPPPKKKTEE